MHPAFEEKRADEICPLCFQLAMKGKNLDTGSWSFVCRTCGIFRITQELLDLLAVSANGKDFPFYKLSYEFRNRSEGLRAPAEIPVQTIRDIGPIISSPDPTVETKLERLLLLLGRASRFPGEKVYFNQDVDYPLLHSKNKDEASFMFEALSSQGFIDTAQQTLDSKGTVCRLTTSGWIEVERVKQTGSQSPDAFVAMWFNENRAEYYRAIAAAIRESGYNPIRIDRVEHINRIDDEIIARIRRSRFLVADFTGQRNGVYFEAGFMLGLGRPVIWICDKEELAKVHFDTRQYNTIDYVEPTELQKRLQVRIEAILGRGPLEMVV